MVILITGGSGMIGKELVKKLQQDGHEVKILSRKKFHFICDVFEWDVDSGYIDPKALENLDVLIHLAGASVAEGRWTSKRKAEILSSRVDAALLLHKKIKDSGRKLKAYITASGIGYYGNRPNETLTETSSKGFGFLPDVCQLWESSAHKFNDTAKSVYVNRTGIVLGNDGGFIAKLRPLFKWHIASALGSGKQFTSWIHITDLVNIIASEINGNLKAGIYNVVSPDAVSHQHLMNLLSKKYKSKIWLPNIPFVALRILFGELAYELIADQNADPTMLKQQNFEFKFSKLEEAIQSL